MSDLVAQAITPLIQSSTFSACERPGEEPGPGDMVVPGYLSSGLAVATQDNEYRLDHICRGLTHVMILCHAPPLVVQSMVGQLRAALVTSLDEIVFVARAKYILAWPLAKYLRCESPELPKDFQFTWKGDTRRWLWRRLTHFSKRNTWLFSSFYQAKRSCAAMTEDFIRMTYLKHRAQMSAPDPLDCRVKEDAALAAKIVGSLLPILKRINRDVLCDYKSVDHDGRRVQVHSPSTRASWEATRSCGGQFGELYNDFFAWLGLEGPLSLHFRPELINIKYFERVVVSGETYVCRLVSTFENRDLSYLWSRFLQWRDDCGFLHCEAPSGPYYCMIQGVLEPLKVRVISKGPSIAYYLSKWFQGSVHRSLRRVPGFELIGRPLDPFLVQRVFHNPAEPAVNLDDDARPMVDPDEPLEFMSGDYSAATDGLSAFLSACILRELTFGLPAREQERICACLAPHRCYYPPEMDIDPIDQKNGQLMGSIVSFVILCLANAGLYLHILDVLGDSRCLSERLSGVLINGDDILYRAPRSFWRTHVELGARIGLKMSVGKAFHHPTFAQVNSMSYHVYPNGHVCYVPFFNTGLFFGQSKVMGSHGLVDDDEKTESISSTVNVMLDAVPCYQQKYVFEEFVSMHRQRLETEAQGRNWFVHKTLGGLGIVPPSGWRWSVNRHQHQIASACMAKENNRLQVEPYVPRFGTGLPSHELHERYTVPTIEDVGHPIEGFSRIFKVRIPDLEPSVSELRELLESFSIDPYDVDRLCLQQEIRTEYSRDRFEHREILKVCSSCRRRRIQSCACAATFYPQFSASGRCRVGELCPRRLSKHCLLVGVARC